MAYGGTVSATSSPSTVFDTATDTAFGGGVTAFKVSNPASGTNLILVNIPALHSTDYVPLAPGESMVFRCTNNGIVQVKIKSDVTATGYYGVVARI